MWDVPRGFEVREVDGEAAIPIDLIASGPPSAEPAANEPAPASSPAEPAPADDIARAAAPRSASPSVDAGLADAGAADGSANDALDSGRNHRAPPAADNGDAARPDAASAGRMADAGAADRHEPEDIVSDRAVRADVVLVELHINADVIRNHPVGARLGELIRALPQWNDFLSGTDIDPLKDIDWVLISGPSLLNTSRDSVLIRYSAPDLVVDRAVHALSARSANGGSFDAGVPGLRAALARADRADRVIFRPQPHLLAVVPPSAASRYARALMTVRLREHPHAKDAVYLRLANPHHPMPEVPEAITEMRVRVVPRDDGGADVYAEGDTAGADVAADAADGVRRMVRRHDDTLTSLLTHGLLDHVDVTTDGSRVEAHLTATRDQIETLVALVSGFLGVPTPPEAPGRAGPPM